LLLHPTPEKLKGEFEIIEEDEDDALLVSG